MRGLSLFAKLESEFLGGFAFFVGFPNDFCPFFCASKCRPLKDFNWSQKMVSQCEA
jgi:hypothetical protein